MKPAFIYRVSFAMAALDLWAATICAAYGDILFVVFMVLCGILVAHGLYFKAKADKKGEEE